jgi:hypothetical protein
VLRVTVLLAVLIALVPASPTAARGQRAFREGASVTVQTRPAAPTPRLPVPAVIRLSSEDPAGLNAAAAVQGMERAYVLDGVIYTSIPLSPTRNREIYWHEVGHIVDQTLLTDAMRRVIARDVFDQPVERWVGDGGYVREPDRDGDIPVREYFADAYAALMLTPPGAWDAAYRDGFVGGYPTPRPVALLRMERLRQVLATLTAPRPAAPDPWR